MLKPWWIPLGANLIKVMRTKFRFCRLNRPNWALWKKFINDTQATPWSNTQVDVSYDHPLYDSAHLGSLYQTKAKCTWDCAGEGIVSVRCNAGPAEGPGKILKNRCNLRLCPLNCINKLSIFIFIILSIFWHPLPATQKKQKQKQKTKQKIKQD